MSATHPSILVAEVPGYAELQCEVHDALRVQHPEWIEADGKSTICDSYEARFAELLVIHRRKCGQACGPTMVRKKKRSFQKPRHAEIVLI